ncbi:MAG: hypothetical protein ACTSVM_06820 [Candidatus Ranarchaeia archaeon]
MSSPQKKSLTEKKEDRPVQTEEPHGVVNLNMPLGSIEISGPISCLEENMESIRDVIKKFFALSQDLSVNNHYQLTLPEVSSNIEKRNFGSSLSIPVRTQSLTASVPRRRTKSLTSRIQALLNDAFFNIPRSAEDVRKQLEQRGYHYETRRISSELTRSFVRRDIMRRLGSRGKYKYVKK